MTRFYGVALFFLASVFLAESGGGGRTKVEARTIQITGVIRIPLATSSAQGTSQVSGNDSTALASSPGAADEPPEGPTGFDIFDDGSILISDPLRGRVVSFDSVGKFRQSWNIGFAADSIRILPVGNILIREAITGQLHAFDREGRPISGKIAPFPEPPLAQKLTATSGSVSNPGGQGNSIVVQLNRPGLSLLSLESLATDGNGNTYVALESTSGESTDGIHVNKTVRKYAANGSLLCETANLPLDYYITPVDELRAHKGKIYQLMTTSSEVQINIWDTN